MPMLQEPTISLNDVGILLDFHNNKIIIAFYIYIYSSRRDTYPLYRIFNYYHF